MIITIGGIAGSGKSTAAKALSEHFGWPRIYVGGIRRQKAKEQGMTLAEYNRLGETDPSTDLDCDNYMIELAHQSDNAIVEGRVHWHLIPDSIKLFIDVDPRVGAERIFQELQSCDARNEDTGLDSVEAIIRSNKERRDSDDVRFKKYYQIDIYDPKNYDLVIDTSHLTKQETFDRILAYIYEKNPKLRPVDKSL